MELGGLVGRYIQISVHPSRGFDNREPSLSFLCADMEVCGIKHFADLMAAVCMKYLGL